MSNSDYLPYAEALADAGYLVCPLRWKCPDYAGLGGWTGLASRHIPEVRYHFSRLPHTGFGIATGEASGCWACDIDGELGRQSLVDLIEANDFLPFGPVTITPNGQHRWFRWTPACKALRNRVGFRPGMDVRTTGGGVVVPPSAHPDGGRYSWRDVTLLDMEPPEAPDWLIAEIVGTYRTPATTTPTSSPATVVTDKYAEGALQSAEHRIATAGNGQQRATLYTEALSIGARIVGPGMCSEATALDRLTTAGSRMVDHNPRKPWTPLAVQRVVSDGLSAGIGRVTNVA